MDWSRSMTIKEYKAIWLWNVFGTHLVLKFEDQDQAQDEVQVLVIIGDHLLEQKGLKQVERKELKEWCKVTHQIKSITRIN